MTPEELAARLEQAADDVAPAIRRQMRRVGPRGVAAIRRHAAGRPGPNIITGHYRASWTDRHWAIPHGALCTIGTRAPQGRRLEFGFWDMYDSLGRHFYQPPYPHVQPALPEIGAVLRDAMGDAIEEVLS
ncbi:hypothetical protein [Streptomyces sp. t39]|uniref:hypothetical protein n=1 Tax=Streptomyces sp. t39 TaxID=1828156 RepID=UPI0011CD4794|nr:hypothetical protein [Streptomyces sp. t39]